MSVVVIYAAKLRVDGAFPLMLPETTDGATAPGYALLRITSGAIELGMRHEDTDISPINPEFAIRGEVLEGTLRVKVGDFERISRYPRPQKGRYANFLLSWRSKLERFADLFDRGRRE